MHKTLRLVGAVLVSGGLLLTSHFVNSNAYLIQYGAAPRGEEDDLRRGLEILRRAHWPMRDVSLCDPLRAIMANQASPAMLEPLDKHDVIICFRNGIDFNEAAAVAMGHGLTWQRGLGGDKIVVFAPSRARFMQVAQENRLALHDDDVQSTTHYLEKLQPHPQARMADAGWLIKPTGGEDEALFGPYLTLQPGSYRLNLAFEARSSDCQALASQVALQVAVTSDARKTTLVDRRPAPLKGDPAGAGLCRLSATLDFTVSRAAMAVETPIWISNKRPVRLVTYDLSNQSEDAAIDAPDA